MGRHKTEFYKILNNKTYFTVSVSMMIRDGFIKLDTYDLYELRDFINDKYINATVTEKGFIGSYIKHGYPLKDFTFEKGKQLRRELCQKAAKKSWEKFNKLTPEEKDIKLKEKTEKQLEGRRNKYKDLSPNESLLKTYRDSIIVKGQNIAKKLNINTDNLSDKQLSKLSGYTKMKNYQMKSKKEKDEYILNWKIKFLQNDNNRETLVETYNDFKNIDVKNLSKKEINMWFARFSSITTSNSIIKGEHANSGYGQSGFYPSKKNNKMIYFRSSYEKKALYYLEFNDKIISYDTEPFHIKYNNGQEIKHYVPDIIFTYKNKQNYLIEVKPLCFVHEFNVKKGQFLKHKNIKILIITENELENKEVFNECIKKYCSNS